MKTLYTISVTTILTFISFISFGFDIRANDTGVNSLSIEILDIKSPSCTGGANGFALVKASGGIVPYTYNWNTFPNQYSEKAVNLSAGIYFVHITDAMGNKFYRPIEINEPNLNRIKNENLSTMPKTSNFGVVSVMKSDSQNSAEIENGEDPSSSINYDDLEVGIYKFEVIDSNNCITETFVQIFEMEEIDDISSDSKKKTHNNETATDENLQHAIKELVSIESRMK